MYIAEKVLYNASVTRGKRETKVSGEGQQRGTRAGVKSEEEMESQGVRDGGGEGGERREGRRG